MMMALRRSSAAGVLLSQAVARRVGLNSSDMECLDLILIDGPASAGEIGRRTGLTSGAVTGLIDRLEGKGLVERVADPRDRRKVLVRARPDKLARIAAMFEPLAAAMTDLMSRYTREQLQTIAEFTERSADAALARVTELNREP
ncbi:MAG TPA: MarR family transcriptional regulator [Alphaproteobacteria bacterium]